MLLLLSARLWLSLWCPMSKCWVDSAQVCLSTFEMIWFFLLQCARSGDVLIKMLRPVQGQTQTWSSLVKYKFVLVCSWAGSGPWVPWAMSLGNLIRENNLKGTFSLRLNSLQELQQFIYGQNIGLGIKSYVSLGLKVYSKDLEHYSKMETLNYSHYQRFQGSHFTSVDFDFYEY